jgi:uncharacterized protein
VIAKILHQILIKIKSSHPQKKIKSSNKNMLSLLFPAVLLGLSGSLHCAGMCGPLLLAMPFGLGGGRATIGRIGLYHAGRIVAYATLGLLFGLAGKTLALAGLQQVLSIAAGIFVFVMAFMAWRFERAVAALPFLATWNGAIQRQIAAQMQQNGTFTAFFLGFFNGLLPCGMVYAALAGAIAAGSPAEGALFMGAFGIGTLPLLLSLQWMGRSHGHFFRQQAGRVQPFLLLLIAALLIQRGLHFDLSLWEAAVPKAQWQCH